MLRPIRQDEIIPGRSVYATVEWERPEYFSPDWIQLNLNRENVQVKVEDCPLVLTNKHGDKIATIVVEIEYNTKVNRIVASFKGANYSFRTKDVFVEEE